MDPRSRSSGAREQLTRYGAAAAPHLELAMTRGRTSLRQRGARLRAKSWQVGQCAIAAGTAWAIATDVFDHQRAFFAPVAAVVCLGTSYGQRLRRVGEVTVGVSLGVFLGDMLIQALGVGGWQVALIVTLAMSTALLLDQGNLLVTQAAVQAVVVATLLPYPGAAFSRWTDALIGGGVALVAAAVVPRAPLRRPREQAGVIVRKISALLRAAAESILDGEVDQALEVLRDARATDELIGELRAAADEGLSVVRSSPFRRRHRGRVRAMAELVEPLDFALRNTRVLVRRVAVAAYRNEPIPPSYAALLDDLANLTDAIADELRAGRAATAVRDRLVELGRETAHVERTRDLSAEVILAQVRSLVADLLAVTGLDPLAATDLIPLAPE
ncbi:aromatic acid exporter family protein [Marmoricola sp. URHB0036]|uniref:FUSC family protein n=1 Tax=Marmoricola sp. URHB0036 TaxID=1298863 RepID=UPI001E514E79|nr:FUSC family protein [Marmoricola sp. URHB0036]